MRDAEMELSGWSPMSHFYSSCGPERWETHRFSLPWALGLDLQVDPSSYYLMHRSLLSLRSFFLSFFLF